MNISIRNVARNNEAILTIAYLIREKRYQGMSFQQIKKTLEIHYRSRMKNELNLAAPQTFTEKIQWLKLYDCSESKKLLSDKYLVREWVKKRIGKEYLIPLIGVWDRFEEIPFSELPKEFCLKMNHGSGMNYIVINKSEMNYKDAQKIFHIWERRPFYAGTLETQYYGISRKIIAEKYMTEFDKNLYDYKFHCFCGKPVFIQCIGDRDLKTHRGCQNNFDLEWNKLDWTFEDYPDFPYHVPKPKELAKMIDLASELSSGYNYVRVDLYNINGQIYFGEMTFTPASGIYPYKGMWTKSRDIELGNMLTLPDKKNNLEAKKYPFLT